MFGSNIKLNIFRTLLFLLPLFSLGQTSSNKQIVTSSFVKKTITLKAGESGFNIVRVRNISESDIQIHPILKLPDGWTIISNSFHDTILAFSDSLSLPFRVKIPSNVYDKDEFEVLFQCFSNANQLLSENVLLVKLEILHKWDVTGPQGRVLLLPNLEETSFEVRLLNRGNTKEIISLELQPDKKLTVNTLDDKSLRQRIILLPNRDTTITFKVGYNFSEERIFDIGKIQISATNGITTVYRSVFVEKYSDKYSPFTIDQGLLNTTEVGFRTFSKNNEVLPYIKTRGTSTFENQGTFKYNFTYYHLTNREDIIGNSYYNFLYHLNDLNVGVGAFSSPLGRNLYSRNSIMVSNKIDLSPSSTLEGYSSFGFIDRKTSVALGYNYIHNQLVMNASASYDFNFEKKINTASFVYHSNKIPITKNQDITAIVYAYQEKHYLNNKYTLSGLAYDLNYFVRLNNKIEFQFSNSYGSSEIPGPQMGLFSVMMKSKFPLKNTKNYISSTYFNTERKYHQYNYSGIKLPYIYLGDQYGNVFFHYTYTKAFRFYIGPSVEVYYSSKPSKESNQREVFKAEKYRLEFKTFYKQFLIISVKYGLGNMYFFNSDLPDRSDYDFHVLTDIGQRGYGVQFSYDYGQMVNSGLYQFALDSKTRGISFSPYVMKSFWQGRIHFNLFSNLTYRFDLQYGAININPRIEAFLFNNWYAVAGGSYNYVHQNYLTTPFGSSFYYLEFAIKKNWGKSSENKWQNDLKRLDVQMFKDENGNGIKDNFEKGVPDIKVRIKLTSVAKQVGNLPVDITLVTNEKGIVSFNNIPSGFYDLIINPLTDMMEYFYIGHEVEKIELLKNKMLKVPFQRANKLEGSIEIKRQKFVKNSELNIDLTNIKVTAYNNIGNSYSAFTDAQGRFILFVPGNQLYYVRISNVFGENFIILNNDIKAPMPETLGHPIVFQVVEKNRQINFKKVNEKKQDSAVSLQKIKVLAGKITQNSAENSVSGKQETAFNPRQDKSSLQKGKFYVVVAEAKSLTEAVRYRKIYTEQGLLISFGYDDIKQLTYIYTNYYDSREQALKEIKILEKMNIRGAKILKY